MTAGSRFRVSDVGRSTRGADRVNRRAAKPGQGPATLRLRPPAWTRGALCDGHPLGPGAWDDATPAAREVCADCPVRLACARHALDNAIPHGLWGGLDPEDRAKIADERKYLPPGTPGHGNRSRYVHRKFPCNCASCREANARWKAEYLATRPADTPRHRLSA